MSYRVVIMIPSKAYPGDREACFCELRYSVKRRFIWFGPRVMKKLYALVEEKECY